jgi:hypothetical protein
MATIFARMLPAAPPRLSRLYSMLEILAIIGLALVPLFASFPYRVNIFLSWEGAYRISQGQVPYRDFGMPMGYMFWVIPALFFKIFGVQLITLVKAQVFINILSGLAFRSILKSLSVSPGIRLLSVLLFCISYSFFNFWPWYNHTVIVYQLTGLAFLMYYLFRNPHWFWLSASALFTFFSFFTKQDGGALALIICLVLLAWEGYRQKNWKPVLVFTASFLVVAFAFIAPLTRFSFGYWFNHGQPPHTARVSVTEIFSEFLAGSQWIKFYIFLILLVLLGRFRVWKEKGISKQEGIFLLLTLGILAEASILQVTSYTPPDNNIFFHSFAFAFLLFELSYFLSLDLNRLKPLIIIGLGLFLWWSPVFWKYLQRIVQRSAPQANSSNRQENVVNRHTFMIHPETGEIPVEQWVYSDLPVFEKVYMPKPTVEGISRLKQRPEFSSDSARILNMTELTPLAAALGFQLEKGRDIPLWHHLGVSMFNREADQYKEKIRNRQYDLVLFEHIPTLNNFYPFRVRDELLKQYNRIDSFYAPRRGGDTRGMIEVFIKK